MTAVAWRESATDDSARTGVMSTSHGSVDTPNFMPVGTRGTVVALDSTDLAELGVRLADADPRSDPPRSQVVFRIQNQGEFIGACRER